MNAARPSADTLDPADSTIGFAFISLALPLFLGESKPNRRKNRPFVTFKAPSSSLAVKKKKKTVLTSVF
jgi:hypothetical protein